MQIAQFHHHIYSPADCRQMKRPLLLLQNLLRIYSKKLQHHASSTNIHCWCQTQLKDHLIKYCATAVLSYGLFFFSGTHFSSSALIRKKFNFDNTYHLNPLYMDFLIIEKTTTLKQRNYDRKYN